MIFLLQESSRLHPAYTGGSGRLKLLRISAKVALPQRWCWDL